jgi:predicted Zn-dependent protease
VIDDRQTKNAFVLPGGKIFVFTGILPVSANDDGLATVLGHEVAHQGGQALGIPGSVTDHQSHDTRLNE